MLVRREQDVVGEVVGVDRPSGQRRVAPRPGQIGQQALYLIQHPAIFARGDRIAARGQIGPGPRPDRVLAHAVIVGRVQVQQGQNLTGAILILIRRLALPGAGRPFDNGGGAVVQTADNLASMIRDRRGRREALRRQPPGQAEAERQGRGLGPPLEQGQDIGALLCRQAIVGVLDPLGDRGQFDQPAERVAHEIVVGLLRRDGREDGHD